MTILRKATVALAIMVATASGASAADLRCEGPGSVEELKYAWRLRGGVRLIAGMFFPTNGVGNLKTTYGADQHIHSELLITAPNGPEGGFYAYESDMDARGDRTLMTYHGYAWGKKSRNERTIFDYVKRLARIRKQTPDEVHNRVKPLPKTDEEFRDVLTAIHFLRRNAHTLTAPFTTTIYSDGKEYPVIFRPVAERRTFRIEGRQIVASGFEIVDAPGGKKWPGGVKVWLSEDAQRTPVRIEISQSVASLQLDLQSIENCGAKG